MLTTEADRLLQDSVVGDLCVGSLQTCGLLQVIGVKQGRSVRVLRMRVVLWSSLYRSSWGAPA